MPRNKLFATVFMLGLIQGCEDSQDRSLLSRWKETKPTYRFERKLASLPKQKCVADLYSVEHLESQIEELERHYQGFAPVAGQWKHLNLSLLPVPQANFLKKYGAKIGDRKDPDAIDYSGCQNVPCIFNRIYGKDHHQAGYVHYLWYLKFGHLLAADNMIPRQSSPEPGEYQRDIPEALKKNPGDLKQYPFKKFRLSEYLFSEAELFSFWRLTMMLNGPYLQLKFLDEVQRIPSGTWQEGNTPVHCGVASKAGYILLMDECLKLSKNNESGFFYLAVPHEMSHHIDLVAGSEVSPASYYYSTTEEYLKVAGLRRVEYMDEAEGTKITFEAEPSAKFITEYAKSSPVENFAETMANFRFNAETARHAVTEDHFNHIKGRFYHGRSFTAEDTWREWGDKYRPFVTEKVLETLSDCAKSSRDEGRDSCLQGQLKDVADVFLGKVMSEEPEACVLLSGDRNKFAWTRKMKDLISSTLAEVNESSKDDPGSLLRDEYKTEARSFFLSCATEKESKSCYETKLAERAREIFPSDELRRLYRGYYSFEAQQQEVLQFYRILLDSHAQPIQRIAKQLWDQCRALGSDDSAPPSGRLFTLAHGYMVSSIYNCLNVGFPDGVRDVLGELRYDGHSVGSEQEMRFLKRDVERRLKFSLQDLHEAAASKEQKEVSALLQSIDLVELKRNILEDESWIKIGQLSTGCRDRILSLVKFEPSYGLKKEYFKSVLEKVNCSSVITGPELKSLLTKKKEFYGSQAMALVESKLMEKGEALENECRSRFPKKRFLSGVFKESEFDRCFDEGWGHIEDEVSHSISRTDLVFRLKITQETLLAHAQKNRKAWQKKIKRD